MQESRQTKQADPRLVIDLTDEACASSVGTDPPLNCVETDSHSDCKKYIQKSTVIKNTTMQESRQTQQADPTPAIDLTEEVVVCDICGDVGNEDKLAICSMCCDGAEHIYCMRVILKELPEGDWMCEECMVKFGCIKSEGETEGVSSTSRLSAKRSGPPLQAQSGKRARVVRGSAISPRSSKPCYSSSKNFKNGKVKATKSLTSAPRTCVDKGKKHIFEAGSDKKRRDFETRVTFPEASKPSNQSVVRRGPPFQNSGKAKLEAARSVSFVKQSSSGFQEKPKSPKLRLQTNARSVSFVKQSSSGFQEKPELTKLRSQTNACSVSFMKQSSSGFQEKPELPKLRSQTKIGCDKWSQLKLGSSKTGDLKVKEGMAKDGCLEKQKFGRYLASDEIRKGKDARVASKAVSSNIVSSEKLNATRSEAILEKAYRPVVFKNSISSGHTDKVRVKRVSKSDNPAMCFPASDSRAPAAKNGNRTIFPDETFSGPNCSRLDSVHSSGRLEIVLRQNSSNTGKDQNCLLEGNKNEIQQAKRPAEAATAMEVRKLSTGLGSDEGSQFAAAILPRNIVIPKFDCIWLGNFQIQRSEGIACIYDGLQAHLSTHASPKVLEVVDKLPEIVVLEELPRMWMWPSQFVERQATEENIGLYFFAQDLSSYERYYEKLMEHMTKNDLALKGNLNGVELLIFPSNVLPEKSQRWNNLLFLWGVFRGRKGKISANTPESSSQKRETQPLGLNAYPDGGGGGDDAVKVKDEDVELPIEEINNADRVEVHGKLPMEGENDDDDAGTSRPSSSLSHASPTNYEEEEDPLALQAAESLVLLSDASRKRP